MFTAHSTRALGVLSIGLLLSLPSAAQDKESDLRAQIEELKRREQAMQLQLWLMKDIEEIKKSQAEIQRELDEIKKLLQARGAAAAPQGPPEPNVAGVAFRIGGNPVRGDRAAQLVLIEFTDYQ